MSEILLFISVGGYNYFSKSGIRVDVNTYRSLDWILSGYNMLTLDSKTHKMKHVDTVQWVHCSGFRKCEIKQTISNALEHKLSMSYSNSWYVSVL